MRNKAANGDETLVGLFALLMLFSTTGYASVYEITFAEGAYKFEPNSEPSAVDSKYLARVTVKRDGQVLTDGIRGSTLPDAWTFYRRWNVELKKTTTPTDTDIVSMFDHFERQTAGLRSSGTKLGNTKLADIADIMDVLNRIPAIPSGTYSFATGLHKQGKSVHGKPYAARLFGSDASNPYDPRVLNSKGTNVGGFIRTLNRNNAQGQQKIAAGINVHDGRTTGDYKDSEGCLTIRPQDWKSFYTVLPSPEEWAKGKHTGRLLVIR